MKRGVSYTPACPHREGPSETPESQRPPLACSLDSAAAPPWRGPASSCAPCPWLGGAARKRSARLTLPREPHTSLNVGSVALGKPVNGRRTTDIVPKNSRAGVPAPACPAPGHRHAGQWPLPLTQAPEAECPSLGRGLDLWACRAPSGPVLRPHRLCGCADSAAEGADAAVSGPFP